MLRGLRKFLSLSAANRHILLLTAVLLVTFRLGLGLVPFRILARRATLRARGGAPLLGIARGFSLERITWAVGCTARYLPGATCLAQALASRILLELGGFPAELRIGIARNGGAGLQGHAWVESRGTVVVGGGELSRYTLLGLGAW